MNSPSPNKKIIAKRIIVTRPAAQAQSWVSALERAGFSSALIPALYIAPFEDGEQVQRISQLIQTLDEFFCLIFVSQNAVAYGFDWIEDYWPEFPIGVHCLSIGAKTEAAARLRMERLSRNDSIVHEHTLMTSEELLKHPYVNEVNDKKVLIFKGSGGRTKLSDVLTERGAQVHYCELYQRMLPPESLDMACQCKIDPHNDVLTIFSGESLENFHFLLTKAKVCDWPLLPTVVPSKRVAKHAKEMGFMNVCVAKNASEDAMLIALLAMVNDK